MFILDYRLNAENPNFNLFAENSRLSWTKFIRLQLILLSNGKWELFVELINGYHWKSNTDLC